MPGSTGFGDTPSLRVGIARLLERTLFVFCVALLVALFAIIITSVFSRAFGRSLTWYDEVSSIGLAWLTFYGSVLAALKGRHLWFDTILRLLPRALRVVVFLAGKALTIAFFCVIAYAGTRLLSIFGTETLVSLDWVSVAFTQSALPVGAALFVLVELLLLPDGLRDAARDPAPEADPLA